MNLVRKLLLLTIFLTVSSCSENQSDRNATTEDSGPDKIFVGGNIYTFDWPAPNGDGIPDKEAPFVSGKWQPDAEAVAVKDGIVIAVGKAEELMLSKSDKTEVVDLAGATMIPGLHDSHVHIAELGQILSQINLIDVETPEEVVKKLKQYVEENEVEEGDWIVGQGWDEGAWANNYPPKSLLDKAFPANPVYLKSLHGFAVWANSAAMTEVGLDSNSPVPIGGEVIKTEDGELSGIFLNRATGMILDNVPSPSKEQFKSWIQLGMQQMLKDGYVAIHQAGAETKHVDAFMTLKEEGNLPIRTYTMLSARDKALANDWIAKGTLIDSQGWLDIRSVKAYYDGALGSRGARLLDDYSDKPGHRGVSGEGYGFDKELVKSLMQQGFQVGIHAIGDAGNRETLNFLEKVLLDNPATRTLRHRIEHAQVLHPNDLERLANLKLIASMEPAHAVEDKKWAEQRLGPQRIKGAYAWRSLKMAGTAMTLNSDLPGSDHSIFYGLHSAVTRKDKSFQPKAGWYAKESLTVEEAVRGFTSDSAYSAFREKQSGKIANNYWADFTIIDINIMEVGENAPEQLLEGKVIMTVIDGNIVYRAY
ncbi:MAG: amidohydrolase [Kangiellaceae bacterium]|nr:amidohydrolase [Kangiellaceae bacterium]MCW8997739.1 amidohydrolase [Kangiellaceae bacterium]